MTNTYQTSYRKDVEAKKIFVTRTFDAPLEKVWKAWTNKEILEQWWAPKPWKAKTKSMNFATGGSWLYAMVGPANEEHWSKAEYLSVVPLKSFHGKDCFCDKDGNPISGFPSTDWKVNFISSQNQTLVEVELSFENEEQLNQLVKMGFEQGFAMAHDNLDEVLKTMK